jgi:hypothetical protein
MNDYINFLQHSIDTSVDMKIFKNRQDASMAHIFKSKLVKIPLSAFTDVDNFNPTRLQNSAVKAYPIHDRPRCDSDISCVKYYQKQIQQKKEISPIWMIQKNNKYILLDGAHRIVASHILGKKNINAYVITLQ